jgi:hypothetical protein
MIGNPGGHRMETPDNRNDQAKAHLPARATAEDNI